MTLVDLMSALLLKPAALVIAALGVTAVMRRTSAASRHAVWTATVGAMLALPLLAAALPDLRFNYLNDTFRNASNWGPRSGTARESVTPSAVAAPPSSSDRVITPDGPSDVSDRIAQISVAVWALVAAALLARRLVAERRVHVVATNGRHASERLSSAAHRVARRHGLRSPTLRVSAQVSSPAVVGIIDPVVLLPEAAESWEATDVEIVLVHELGHVERRDCLRNFCADVAAALYWCNPFVAYAARRVRLEGERACDERVINAGAEPDVYAALLLRMVRADRSALTSSAAASAMSRPRELESRIIALLDERVPYPSVSRVATTLLIAIGITITVPAAAFTLTPGEVPIEQATTGEPDQLGDFIASASSERVPLQMDERELERRTAQALAGRDSILAHAFAMAREHAPSHANDLVSERASWALSRTTNGRLVEPLLESLEDSDWRIQSYAAWALASAGDSRAVPRLVPLVQHRVWRLRAMAAFALRASRDVGAIAVMRGALADPAWQVRSEAVAYLADVGGDSLRDAIRARLDDRHVAVRRAAQQALRIP